VTVPAIPGDGFGGVPGVQLKPTGLLLPESLSYELWEQVGFTLGVLRDLTAWALGDWILFGEGVFGEMYAQGVEVTGRKKDTLLEYARVARQVPRERRRNLSFTHHQIVAARPPEEQDLWLDRAEANVWSCEELRGAIQDPDRALSTRPRQNHSQIEHLELVETVARDLLDAAQPLSAGYRRVPEHVLDRLANALGVTR